MTLFAFKPASTPELIIELMKPHLTLDLAPPSWRARAIKNKITRPGYGCCYPAAEVLYHLWGKKNGFKPHFLKNRGGGHWFLKHMDGRVLDPTACQFFTPPDYTQSRGCGFLTKKLSKRGQILLKRIGLKY